jgi:hypothetical protein
MKRCKACGLVMSDQLITEDGICDWCDQKRLDQKDEKMALIELINGPYDGELCDLQGLETETLFFVGGHERPYPIGQENIRPGDHIIRYKYQNRPHNKKRYVFMRDYISKEGDPDFLPEGEVGGQSVYGPL